MRLMKSKKGQLYIITMLLLSAFVFTASIKAAKTNEPTQQFELLTENYMNEGTRVVNSAIYNEKNVTGETQRFSDKFIEHANTKNINLYLLYLIIRDNKVTVYNKMDSSANITAGTTNTLLSIGNITIFTTSSLTDNLVNVRLGEQDYLFTINPSLTEFKAILKTKSENSSEIRIHGQ